MCFHLERFLPGPEGPLGLLSISLVAVYKILAISLSVNVSILFADVSQPISLFFAPI